MPRWEQRSILASRTILLWIYGVIPLQVTASNENSNEAMNPMIVFIVKATINGECSMEGVSCIACILVYWWKSFAVLYLHFCCTQMFVYVVSIKLSQLPLNSWKMWSFALWNFPVFPVTVLLMIVNLKYGNTRSLLEKKPHGECCGW